MSKSRYFPGLTKLGTFVYPKISKPDTKGEFADGKYKTDFALDSAADTKAFRAEIVAKAKELLPEAKKPTLPIVEKDDGTILFRFKTQNKPVIVDAKRKKIPEDVFVRGGSKGRISYTLFNWEKGSKRGISLMLDAVQITELVEGSPGEKAFDDIDGFDSSDLENRAPEDAFGDDAPPPSSDDDYDL